MPPTKRVNVTFLYKDGTSSPSHEGIEFFSILPMLRFAEQNASIPIDDEKIDSVLIENKKYLIDYLEKEKDVQTLKLRSEPCT